MISAILDPYSGITASQITSNVIPLRNAVDFSLSAWTSAGTSSIFTLQVSDSGFAQGDIAAASWSNFTVLTEPSAATIVRPFDNMRGMPRWLRLLRNPSVGSFVLAAQVREK